jgi:hypothetical protein
MSRWAGNLNVERQGDTVSARPVFNAVVVGALWIAGLALITAMDIRDGSVSLDDSVDLAILTFLGIVGLFTLVLRTIVTTFDSTNRKIVQDRILFTVFRWRRRSYPFAEVASAGVDEYQNNEGQTEYHPTVALKNGVSIRLLHNPDSQSNCAAAVEEICATTGLPRSDKTWRDESEGNAA